MNLENAVEREKAVQNIGAPRKVEKIVVTHWVMRAFSSFLGASKACADFRESTAVSRLKLSSFFYSVALLTTTLSAEIAQAARYILPPSDVPIVGRVQHYSTIHTDTLADIARLYGVGHDEIVAANPDVDVWIPGEAVDVVIPSRFILPGDIRQGIVVNLPEMRLYHYGKDSRGKSVVTTHPVSVGRMDWKTPLGATKVVARAVDPNWYPPKSIREEHAADGDPLPAMVPAGPDNPLGRHMLRLGIPGYLIHGTNRPYGVGMRVTHGCLRMYPEDIAWLYDDVEVSTPVVLMNKPFKVARLGGRFFVEIHQPLEDTEESAEAILQRVLEELEYQAGREAASDVDLEGLLLLIRQANGVPAPIPLKIQAANSKLTLRP